MLENKRVLIGIAGGVSAYKILTLIRRLKEHGAEVRVCLSESAKQFVTPLSCQALLGHPIEPGLFDPMSGDGMRHIALAKWADLYLLAPATADVMARMAQGHANDMITNVYLAFDGPVAMAPAMNQQMWLHPATQINTQVLQARGVQVWGPDDGVQACGDTGPGRMLEADMLCSRVLAHFSEQASEQSLRGQRVLITAGPTVEAIDPVRCLTNHSSGMMAYAMAEAASVLGAYVTMVSGPCTLPCPSGVTCHRVQTAEEMLQQVKTLVSDCDIFVGAAAVSDYRPVSRYEQKIKKHDETMTIVCEKNPDILSYVGHLDGQVVPRPFTIGFAAETDDLVGNASLKMQAKKCDLMIANWVGPHRGMHRPENELTLINQDGETQQLPLQSKTTLAYVLWSRIVDQIRMVAVA